MDLDECSETGMCANGKCVNIDGSFKCVCDSGYRLGPDRKVCVGKQCIKSTHQCIKFFFCTKYQHEINREVSKLVTENHYRTSA